MKWLRCRLCLEAGDNITMIPNDEQGGAKMRVHLLADHGIGAEQVDVPLIKVPPAIRLDRP